MYLYNWYIIHVPLRYNMILYLSGTLVVGRHAHRYIGEKNMRLLMDRYIEDETEVDAEDINADS